MGKKNRDGDWAEAKKRCRLSAEDVRMAKELGMSPRSLMKNIPNAHQQWKQPVKLWIHELYEKRFRHRDPAPAPAVRPAAPVAKTAEPPLDHIPF